MFRLLGMLMVVTTTLFSASNSIGSSSVEETVKKRIEMFKSSSTNLKKLNKLIRSGDISASVKQVDFHIKWSEEMLLLFPIGSEASTSNGSDASSDIWRDTTGFKKRVSQYNLSSKNLKNALKINDMSLINKNFKDLVESCKTCHRYFRN